ncbi:MAG: prolyl oligopeptidase family serine peptidase [Gemmatimonadetes bacterium]|nr:prolyl oligopeptidase family serine peptidase [Gemmatimonadota bacterium]
MIRTRVRNSRPCAGLTTALAVFFAFGPAALFAQGPSDGDTISVEPWQANEVLSAEEFVAPPGPIAEAALAPRWLNVSLSNPNAGGTWFMDEVGDGPVGMDTFSKPFHELGGMFIDFAANRDRRLTIRNNVGIDLYSSADGRKVSVDVPDGARVSGPSWSPDGASVAFFAHFGDATHIYVADAESGDSRRVTPRPVLATMVTSFEWTADGAAIATVLVPEDRPAMPVEPAIPMGPQVKKTEDGDNRLRTYASLMETPYQEDLLEWHATGQLAMVGLDGDVTEVGQPAMIRGIEPAPTGRHVRVERMTRPFSYVVPVRSFGGVDEVWAVDGSVLVELDSEPVDTGIRDDDDDDDDSERRQVAWSPDGTALTFLQMDPAPPEDEGDAAADTADPADEDEEGEGRRMDHLMVWPAPFDEGTATPLYSNRARMQSYTFSDDGEMVVITSRRGQQTSQYAVFPAESDSTYTLAEWSADDFYDRPGSLVSGDGTVSGGFRFGGGGGSQGILTSSDGGSVYYAGVRYDEDPMTNGPRSFVDRVEIRTGEKERIFESSNQGASERVSAILDAEAGVFIVDRESPRAVPQSFRVEGDARVQLTENVDYTPDLTAAPVERFVVTRPDGFRFRVTVTLPPGYVEGTRLPAMFWFYPREYDGQESYDERARTYDRNAFPSFGTRSMEYLVRLGYAVVEPDAPIVGPQGRMNDNYEHDLRNNLAAVIDELDRREIIDRQRLGLGGHSYGAFSTVNAMVHTPFFKAGIAGDGNYNRTLTPMAFQSERRLLWEARDVYLSMSPFMYANNLTGALLMYHGLQDQNVGTHPSHAPRLFHALNGLNKDAAMYLYPFEDHGPATRETILDLWARWTAWLEVHLGPDETTTRPITFEDGSPPN